jgi:hypothetical protein
VRLIDALPCAERVASNTVTSPTFAVLLGAIQSYGSAYVAMWRKLLPLELPVPVGLGLRDGLPKPSRLVNRRVRPSVAERAETELDVKSCCCLPAQSVPSCLRPSATLPLSSLLNEIASQEVGVHSLPGVHPAKTSQIAAPAKQRPRALGNDLYGRSTRPGRLQPWIGPQFGPWRRQRSARRPVT